MITLSPYDITSGLVDAVKVWSEYLTNIRTDRDWGVYGAQKYFESIGFSIPSKPITSAELAALITLQAIAEKSSVSGKVLTTRDIKKDLNSVEKYSKEVSQYFKDNCDILIDPDQTPGSTDLNAICDSLQTAVDVAKSEYEDAASALQGFDVNQSSPNNQYDDQVPNLLNEISGQDPNLQQDDINLSDGEYYHPPVPGEYGVVGE